MKRIIKKIPIVSEIVRSMYHKLKAPPRPIADSREYWINRYNEGGTSGDGSYNELAKFKAKIINEFVFQNEVNAVIEYGCGDGNQLKLAKYPHYIGFDVSPTALSMCKLAFQDDDTKKFKLMDEFSNETAELTLSLDVIYHLIEDNVFADYMSRLFSSSRKFVIIYSSNAEVNPEIQTAPHVKHRKFTNWVESNLPEWQLLLHIPNEYPFIGDTLTGSFADFYIYKKF